MDTEGEGLVTSTRGAAAPTWARRAISFAAAMPRRCCIRASTLPAQPVSQSGYGGRAPVPPDGPGLGVERDEPIPQRSTVNAVEVTSFGRPLSGAAFAARASRRRSAPPRTLGAPGCLPLTTRRPDSGNDRPASHPTGETWTVRPPGEAAAMFIRAPVPRPALRAESWSD